MLFFFLVGMGMLRCDSNPNDHMNRTSSYLDTAFKTPALPLYACAMDIMSSVTQCMMEVSNEWKSSKPYCLSREDLDNGLVLLTCLG